MPVAAALSRDRALSVRLYAASQSLGAAAAQLMHRLDCGPFELSVLRLPAPFEAFHRDSAMGSSLKLPRLLWHARQLRQCAALVTAERTSSALKRLPGPCPPMIHLRHGAGDRAVGFEPRIALFDELIVAGQKDRSRTIAAGLLPAEHCHACGYIKLSTVRQLRGNAPPLFDNDRPTVLYNPHFLGRLSSWHEHGRALIDAIRDSGAFNLIVAPHVRMFAGASRNRRREWECLAVPGEVLVDLGSERSLDMTYTLAADIYLGDVSSQIYEFAAMPRPCVFVDSHHSAWRGNPDYRMWEMGEVIGEPASVVAALQRAPALHAHYRDVQQHLVAEAIGDFGPDCAERAARIIRATALKVPAGAAPARDQPAYPHRWPPGRR